MPVIVSPRHVVAFVLCGSALGCSEPSPAASESTSSSSHPGTESSSSPAPSDSSSGAVDPETTSSTPDTSSSSSSASADESTGDDTPIDPCALPDPRPDWLMADLQSTVSMLSGASELSPGVTLPNRGTFEHRTQAATWLLQRIGELGLTPESHDYGPGTNLFARLPATIASEGTLVIGAHYDSIATSPGAADNGTGTAAILAATRHLQTVACRRYDVLLVFFDQEEAGLQGSAAFAAKLVTDTEPVIAVHTIDMIAFDGDGDGVIEIDQPDPGLDDLYDEAGALLDPPVEVAATASVLTDYQAFQDAGFAAVGLMEEYVSGDTTPHWHQPTDTYDNVDFEYLTSGVALLHQAIAMDLLPAE